MKEKLEYNTPIAELLAVSAADVITTSSLVMEGEGTGLIVDW